MAKFNKTKVLLCILFLTSLYCKAQRITTFQRSYGGSKDDFGASVVKLPDNGYMMAGRSTTYSSDGNNDILIVRTDSLGKIIWSKTYGGSADEGTNSAFTNAFVDIILTPDSDVVVCSSTESYGAGGRDVYFFKLDLNGNAIWSRTYGGSADDEGIKVMNDPNGGFLITGETKSYGAGNGDVLIIKTDAAGGIIWSKTYGNSGNEEIGYDVTSTPSGNFIICGYSYSSSNSYDQMIMEVDNSGKLIWSKDYGTSSNDIATSVVELPDRSIYVSGITPNSFLPANTVATVSKLDSTGKLIWTKIYDKAVHSGSNTILYDKSKNVLNLNLLVFETGTQRSGFMRIDSSGGIKFVKYYGPSSSSNGYTYGYGHNLLELPSGGFAMMYVTQVFGFGGADYYFLKLDSAANSSSCNTTALSLSPFDYTSYMNNNSYAFTTSSISPTIDSGIVVKTVTAGDSLICTPFVAGFNLPNTCAGQKAQFYDSSYYKPISWSWNFGDAGSSSNTSALRNPAHTYSSTGSYIVSLISGNGAQSDTIKRTVTIYPLPTIASWSQNINYDTVSFIPKDTTIGKFKWYFGDPDSNTSPNKKPTFTYPNVKGSYLVKLYVTSKYGCVSEKSDSVDITKSGIEQEVNTLTGIQIFPNPFEGVVHIDYQLQSRSKVDISIYDLVGKKVAQLKNGIFEAGQYSDIFDATKCHCSNGTYILKMTVNDRVYTARIEAMER